MTHEQMWNELRKWLEQDRDATIDQRRKKASQSRKFHAALILALMDQLETD